MKIDLPNENGQLSQYELVGEPLGDIRLQRDSARVIFAAAHVVGDPFSDSEPSSSEAIDWETTMSFRRYLHDLGLGIAEAMDTAQRGMGLDWNKALELITRTKKELPDAVAFNGCGTEQLRPSDCRSLEDIQKAYLHQIESVQKIDGRIIVMASRALAAFAKSPDDYIATYRNVLASCDKPVILHWLGEMFDPALAGYWGAESFEDAMETALAVIAENSAKIDGIKISLLDKDKEIIMRRRLPENVKMYTGDDFNYPELIAGDDHGYSHALLGIFDPLAAAAAKAVNLFNQGDTAGFHAILDPTVPLARHVFRAPTQYYKTGVVFLAWLNGFQEHFVMLGGAQSMRPLPYFVDCFKLADQAGVLRNPELAVKRMQSLMAVYGA